MWSLSRAAETIKFHGEHDQIRCGLISSSVQGQAEQVSPRAPPGFRSPEQNMGYPVHPLPPFIWDGEMVRWPFGWQLSRRNRRSLVTFLWWGCFAITSSTHPTC